MFASIDAMDADKFVTYLSDNAVFRFGNMPDAVGKPAVHEMVSGFFKSITGMSHRLNHIWEVPGHVIVQGDVTYIRLDSKKVSMPFCTTFGMENELIRDYFIHIDVTPLYAE